jgi:hypothetical protein
MADEHFDERSKDLNDSLDHSKVSRHGKPLETRIKQEGILTRLGLPIQRLIHYTAIAVKAMFDETREDDE